ncbi:Riboflavin synthase [Candidatus Gugararchaeum adminiculabundum]|nr:Riboflavin synthase [Candidatus Gugararchaeum adminiculabundum]
MNKKLRIGFADTTFARADMVGFAIDEIEKKFPELEKEFVRRTVPGVKDLGVECKLLYERDKCDIVMAFGMVGGAAVDKTCGHEASLGIQMAKMLANKHIIEVFVHEDEGENAADLLSIFEDRSRKHAVNAVLIATNQSELTKLAGKGLRQGRQHVGELKRN